MEGQANNPRTAQGNHQEAVAKPAEARDSKRHLKCARMFVTKVSLVILLEPTATMIKKHPCLHDVFPHGPSWNQNATSRANCIRAAKETHSIPGIWAITFQRLYLNRFYRYALSPTSPMMHAISMHVRNPTQIPTQY